MIDYILNNDESQKLVDSSVGTGELMSRTQGAKIVLSNFDDQSTEIYGVMFLAETNDLAYIYSSGTDQDAILCVLGKLSLEDTNKYTAMFMKSPNDVTSENYRFLLGQFDADTYDGSNIEFVDFIFFEEIVLEEKLEANQYVFDALKKIETLIAEKVSATLADLGFIGLGK